MSSSSSPSSSHQRTPEERRALQEAQQVLESLENDALDNFNLLGVVANPRAGGPHAHHERSASRSGSYGGTSLHGRSQHGRSSDAAASSQNESSFYFADSTMQVFESTLSTMTEQIDVLNDTLEYWSRQYLGTYDEHLEILEYTPPQLETAPSGSDIPQALQTDLSSLQTHLEQSGHMAQAFAKSLAVQQQQQSLQEEEEESLEQGGEGDSSIDPLFFQEYLDLTDPSTFLQLLVREEQQQDNDTLLSQQQQQQQQDNGVLTIPTHQILQLPPPDYFTPSLDRVEVSLLNQVREKSAQFFHETNRFGLLQEWIASLVVECKRVRSILDSLKYNSVQAWELIPQLDSQRRDSELIAKVLDSALDVIRCKASIGGLLSAGEDLHAAEQIQYGRTLLQSEEIHGLQALHTVEPQLSQYEALVVANLGNELMEVFLDFGAQQHKSRVPELVRGLQLCHALDSTGKLYGNRLNDVIRMTVRTTVGEFAEENNAATTTVKAGVTSMTLERFLDCLDMLFEQLSSLLRASVGVKEFCAQEGIVIAHENQDLTAQAVTSAAELSSKSISELLRLRKDAHSLVTLEEMKRLWDVCMSFTTQFENLTDYKATGLRSTLLAQAKAFVEHKHESDMSALVAALESERWTQCDVSAERQDALTRLCLGRAVMYTSTKRFVADEAASPVVSSTGKKKVADAEVEGVRYKVVWSCLLLIEMVMTDLACATHFKALATNMVGKVAELLRLFNSRSTKLVLGAGAMHSAARLKSINAKHLSLVTQCVGLVISILPHVRAALMAQLPAKQHTLLNDLDTIKREYEEHNEKVLNKFVNIIGGIVEHGLAPRIGNTNFDARAKDQIADAPISFCIFLEGISTNTRKMHQVLSSLLPPDHLQDSFSRIFAYLDQKLPELFLAASVGNPPSKPPTFSLPTTDEGKKQMLLEVQTTTKNLNELPGVRPWDFSAVSVLEQELDYKLNDTSLSPPPSDPPVVEADQEAEESQSPVPDEIEPDSHSATDASKPVGANGEQGADQGNGESDLASATAASEPLDADRGDDESDPVPATAASEPLVTGNGQIDGGADPTIDASQSLGASNGAGGAPLNANVTAEPANGDSAHDSAMPHTNMNGSADRSSAESDKAATEGDCDKIGDPVLNEPTDDQAKSINGDVS